MRELVDQSPTGLYEGTERYDHSLGWEEGARMAEPLQDAGDSIYSNASGVVRHGMSVLFAKSLLRLKDDLYAEVQNVPPPVSSCWHAIEQLLKIRHRYELESDRYDPALFLRQGGGTFGFNVGKVLNVLFLHYSPEQIAEFGHIAVLRQLHPVAATLNLEQLDYMQRMLDEGETIEGGDLRCERVTKQHIREVQRLSAQDSFYHPWMSSERIGCPATHKVEGNTSPLQEIWSIMGQKVVNAYLRHRAIYPEQ